MLRTAAWLILMLLPAGVLPQATDRKPDEVLQYSVEWRLVRSGTAVLSHTKAAPGGGQKSDLHLETVGLVNKLYRVNDIYSVRYDSSHCASSTYMKAEEGSRRRETKVSFDSQAKKSNYLERDTAKNTVVLDKELDIPACVHDVVAALNRLRTLRIPPGESVQLPITDGKRMVNAKVEAQAREEVETPSGTYKTIRYEAFLFNDVLYSRKGRLFIWITDDERRLPVQIRARLNFPVGTISLSLEKLGQS
jgi:hypothetical protein